VVVFKSIFVVSSIHMTTSNGNCSKKQGGAPSMPLQLEPCRWEESFRTR